MDEPTMRRFALKAEMFKALSHPVRILMLERLREKPWCVCELAVEAGVGKSVASKHLSQLRAAGLVEMERRGTQVEYRITAPCILDMADCAEGSILESRRRRLGIEAIRESAGQK